MSFHTGGADDITDRIISRSARQALHRSLRLSELDQRLLERRARHPSALAQIECDSFISSAVEFEGRLGRCALSNALYGERGVRAAPRDIATAADCSHINEGGYYDLFTADVASHFFVAVFAALNGDATTASAASLLGAGSPVIAISGWHRKEEVAVYDESDDAPAAVSPDGSGGANVDQGAEHPQPKRRRRYRVLLDASRATYCVNASTFDNDRTGDDVRHLLRYLECEDARYMETIGGDGASGDEAASATVWKAKEERLLPDAVWWLPEDTPHGVVTADNGERHKLCIEKERASECVLGSTKSAVCDIRFSLCEERNRTELLPDQYFQACNAAQRVEAIVSSRFPAKNAASHARTSLDESYAVGESGASGRQGGFNNGDSSLDLMLRALDIDEETEAIFLALQGSIFDLRLAEGDASTATTMDVGVPSATSVVDATTAAVYEADNPPTIRRGRPPKKKPSTTTAHSSATAVVAEHVSVATDERTGSSAGTSLPVRTLFDIPPIYRVKLRQSVLLGVDVVPDGELCSLIMSHVSSQLEHDAASVTALFAALRRRPLWRVDFTKVWQSDSLERARNPYRTYAKTAKNAAAVTVDGQEQDVQPSSYEIEVECVDVVYWCMLICQCDASKTPQDALVVIASAMACLLASGVLSSVVPSVDSHIASPLGSLLPAIWVHRPKLRFH